jgi:hypothetical protein
VKSIGVVWRAEIVKKNIKKPQYRYWGFSDYLPIQGFSRE